MHHYGREGREVTESMISIAESCLSLIVPEGREVTENSVNAPVSGAGKRSRASKHLSGRVRSKDILLPNSLPDTFRPSFGESKLYPDGHALVQTVFDPVQTDMK